MTLTLVENPESTMSTSNISTSNRKKDLQQPNTAKKGGFVGADIESALDRSDFGGCGGVQKSIEHSPNQNHDRS
jgi:hypothetical protein